MGEKVRVNIYVQGQFKDEMEVPVDITVVNLLQALNTIYKLNLSRHNIYSKYLKADFPKALLKGDHFLKDYGIRDGSQIFVENRNPGEME